MTGAPPVPEFSRIVAVDHVPARGMTQTIEASPAELAAVATRLGIPEVLSLVAEVKLTPKGRSGLIRVDGRLTAEVVQLCGVTLRPFGQCVSEHFRMSFGPPDADGPPPSAEIDLDWDDDMPDSIQDGAIDIGEAVVEHLALGLDPFPRAPDAVFTPLAEEDESAPKRPNPFAVLRSLRDKRT